MLQRHRKKRIEIVAEALLLDRLLELIKEAGATGYTVHHYVSGADFNGRRGEPDDLSLVLKNIQLNVIADDEVAERIVEGCAEFFDDYAEIVVISDVEVIRPERF